MKTLIRNALVVFPNEVSKSDLLIEDGRIADIGKSIKADGAESVDASGFHLLPGVIDDQVHFREPGFEHKEDLRTGSRACAKGGITTFFEMPNTNPSTTTVEALQSKLQRASEQCVVNYAFYMGATSENVKELQKAKEFNTPGIKIFIGSSTGNLLVDKQQALETIFAETDLPITAHCEDESTVLANKKKFEGISDVAVHSKIRDHEAAIVCTKRAIDLSTRHNHPFHVLHVSTRQEVELLRDAPEWVTAEACPHHLFFNVDDYDRLGSRIQMNPSVKTRADNEAIWQGLVDGDINIIATDHAPHLLSEKELPYPQSPSGMPAVENSLALLLNQVNQGRCTLLDVAKWMCEGPAKIWGVPNKGRIEVGFDADIVLVDLDKTDTIVDKNQITKCGWSAWHGQTLTGWPVRTWVMGNEVFRDGTVAEQPLGTEVQFQR